MKKDNKNGRMEGVVKVSRKKESASSKSSPPSAVIIAFADIKKAQTERIARERVLAKARNLDW